MAKLCLQETTHLRMKVRPILNRPPNLVQQLPARLEAANLTLQSPRLEIDQNVHPLMMSLHLQTMIRLRTMELQPRLLILIQQH